MGESGGTTHKSDDDQARRAALGVAANLGLPLAPRERVQPVPLPPPGMTMAGKVPLPSPVPTEVLYAVATPGVQSGRVRLTGLISQGLQWPTGQPLSSKQTRLPFGRTSLPALEVQPAGKRHAAAAMRLNAEHRLTIGAEDRRFLGIGSDGGQVLAVLRLSTPSVLLLLGAPSVSLVLGMVWPDEV